MPRPREWEENLLLKARLAFSGDGRGRETPKPGGTPGARSTPARARTDTADWVRELTAIISRRANRRSKAPRPGPNRPVRSRETAKASGNGGGGDGTGTVGGGGSELRR